MTVTDTLPVGLTPTAADSGIVNGWNVPFSGQTITATRSDALASGASYPALALTVGVASNAPASVTNTASVAGGGELNTTNDTASDLTVITPVADLTIAKSHNGNFTQGDSADLYTITVSNIGSGSTDGSAVTVTDTLPTGLTPTAADNGFINGWSVSVSGQTITAIRSDTLTSGASYPALTLTVGVANNSPASVTNRATVAGGGESNAANDTASDLTAITPVADLTIAKSHNGNFTQGDSADTYTLTVSNVGLGSTTGTVTVTDTLPAGLAPTAADNGLLNGWNVSVSGQTITASRSDLLTGGTSYPALLLTVSVASNSPVSVTNSASVAGGGELNTTNDTASDLTTITQVADLTISKSHAGNFAQGDSADIYTLTVSNVGLSSTTGSVTVTDTLPAAWRPQPPTTASSTVGTCRSAARPSRLPAATLWAAAAVTRLCF